MFHKPPFFPLHEKKVAPPWTAPSAQGKITQVPLFKGPFQNNGATPWYALSQVGSPGQALKIALDTGSNFQWTTSSLCPTNGGIHYGDSRFHFENSSSFLWVDKTLRSVDFGPWGQMSVAIGQDLVALPQAGALKQQFYLSADYSGSQFEQLDWDGGIGLPSGSAYVDRHCSFIVEDLLNSGKMDPGSPYISFYSDPSTGRGQVLFGGYDESLFDFNSGLRLPWTAYTEYSGVEYIWTTGLKSYSVGQTLVASDAFFCLDSGSSQFKGDNDIMAATLNLVGSAGGPDVTLELGITGSETLGKLVVPPSVYMTKIEAGPSKDLVLPQFNPLNLANLVLVGSVLMDQLYTIFSYQVTPGANGYQVAPDAMYIFNKINGPKLIQTTGKALNLKKGGK